jgi:hypothetical protein
MTEAMETATASVEAAPAQAPQAAPVAAPVETSAAVAPAAEVQQPVIQQTEVQNDYQDFVQSIPEEYRGKVTKKGFQNVEDVLKSYVNLESMQGKRFEDLTVDEIRSMNTRLGAPEDPSGYEIEVPTELGEVTMLEGYTQKAHELGVPKETAENLANWFIQNQLEQMNMHQATTNQNESEKVETLKQEFGTAFDARIEMANKALRKFGGDEAVNAIHSAGLSNDPALVKMLSEVGKLIAEDTFVGPKSSPSFGVTPDEANKQIAEKFKDQAFMSRWHNQADPGHKAAVAELEQLYKLKNGQQ